jgi:hypothetical protein
MLALCIVPSACKDEHWVERTKAPKELNEPLIRVASGRVVSGFKHGRLRQEFDVAGFRISRSPVTVAQFQTCLEDGPCKAPAHDCANLDGDDHDVALCVGYENAQQYCEWSGARLPRLNEWLLAARGGAIKRFSWGDGAATCEQHPLAPAPEPSEFALAALAGLDPEELTPERIEQLEREALKPPPLPDPKKTACGVPRKESLRVGKHRAGAAPSGLEDVLLSKSELLVGHRETNFSACMSDEHGCLVYGLTPGGIDAVGAVRERPVSEVSDQSGSNVQQPRAPRTEHPYAFRCVWSEEGV